MVSHIYGAKSREELRPTIVATFHLGLMWAVTMAFIFVVARGALVGIFSDNAEVVALSANLLLLIAIYQFSDAIQGLSISMLRGLQDVKIIMPIVLCSYLVLNIPENEKYMAIFKKVLTGSFGQSLLPVDFSAQQVMEGQEYALLSALRESALTDEDAVSQLWQQVCSLL